VKAERFSVDVSGVESSTRVEESAYDINGRLVAVHTPEGILGYTYDKDGQRTSVAVYDSGVGFQPANLALTTAARVAHYTYDDFGRLLSVTEDSTPGDTTDLPQILSEYDYDIVGRMASRTTTTPASGTASVTTNYEYDELGRLDTQTDTDQDGNTLASYDYTVRADGKRTQLEEQIWFDENQDGETQSSELKANSYTWSYDEVGRLTDEVLNHWDDDFDQSESFTYDLTGNRTELQRDLGNDSVPDTVTTYTYDSNDRLLEEILDDLTAADADTTTSYTYDHTQQTEKLVTRSVSEGQHTVSRQLFSYNLQGRMSAVTNEGYDAAGVLTSRERTSYDYDTRSYRVELVVEDDPDLDLNTDNWQESTRTTFLADCYGPN